jgi:hypothetical protein
MTLPTLDKSGWQALGGQIDTALKAVRAGRPDPAAESRTLDTLLTSLG